MIRDVLFLLLLLMTMFLTNSYIIVLREYIILRGIPTDTLKIINVRFMVLKLYT